MNTNIELKFFDHFEIRFSVDKSRIDDIWNMAAPYFNAREIDELRLHTSDTLEMLLILCARDIYHLSSILDPDFWKIEEGFRLRQKWYNETFKEQIFQIYHWPTFSFYYEDFKIKEVPNHEPF